LGEKNDHKGILDKELHEGEAKSGVVRSIGEDRSLGRRKLSRKLKNLVVLHQKKKKKMGERKEEGLELKKGGMEKKRGRKIHKGGGAPQVAT